MTKLATILAVLVLATWATAAHAQTTACEGQHLYRVIYNALESEPFEYRCANGPWEAPGGSNTCCGYPISFRQPGNDVESITPEESVDFSSCRYHDDQLLEVTVTVKVGSLAPPVPSFVCVDR